MPVPASVRFDAGRLPVTKSFTVGLRGQADERLRSYLDRAARRLEARTGMQFARGFAADAAPATLVVECERTAAEVPVLREDESYRLEVTNNGATLRAPTTVGAMRGIETFLQLLASDREGFFIPAVSINDRPRFPWRGLMIDVARHFQPVEVIKRNLDAMAAVKLNVLHWHLTDDQGFRIESKRFPRLHQLGSDGLYFTQEQARDIISYAAARGIRVIPEFDMPGHVTSWLVGHPELGSAPGPYTIERQPGVFDPSLDPTREETYKFIDKFLGEMANLFPDAYLHVGGDENTGKHWRLNPRIQKFMQEKGIKDKHALHTYFNQHVAKIVRKHGKRMMGWDEILQPDLPNDVVIHSWRGQKALADAARQGYDGVLSNGYYIDLMQSTTKHYLTDPLPADNTLTEAEAAHVLGGEATMWAEWVSPETIDSRVWTRTAAIAERFWSPREVTDVDDMYRRLDVVSLRLEELGLTHEKNQAAMLRRLIGGENIAALQTLVSVVEPVKEYRRYQQRPRLVTAPLTGLIDAARADSRAAREFRRMVDELLSDAPRFRARSVELRDTLARWRDAGAELRVTMQSAPALSEERPLADDLTEIATIGAEALRYLDARITPGDEWRDRSFARLEQAAAPKPSAVEFPFLPSMRLLVVAAHEQARLAEMTPTEWREHVARLAAPPALTTK